MRLLFLGDIVGEPGRRLLAEQLPRLREELGLNWVIANGENAAAGSGITGKMALEILAYGVDGLTLGDHLWDQRGFSEEIGALERVCRPANLPVQNPGRRFLVMESGGVRLGVATVLGRTFMKTHADCPLLAADALIEELRPQCDALLIEIHAEATSEKVGLGWYLDGRVLGVVGTHTHVPTADARVLPRGTAYQTDAGMCGPYQSVIGREIEPILGKMLDGMPRRWPVATGDARLCGTLIDFDPSDGLATSCQRFEWAEEAQPAHA